ncbi:MAG: hypothetical protein AAF518_07805 [Spirochaetota bacterium]
MMKNKTITRIGIFFLVSFTIHCSSYIVFHGRQDKNGYQTEEEKQYEEVLQRYRKKFPRSYSACRRYGEFRVDGVCKQANEKYQTCYLEKRGLITDSEEDQIIKLTQKMRKDRITEIEKGLGQWTLWLLPVGFDYITHLFHVNERPELEIRKFYQQKTQGLSSALEECSQYEPGTAYWKRTKYSNKLSELQAQLLGAENELAKVEKVVDAKQIVDRFDPVFSKIENVFNLAHIEGVVTGIRKDYVIVQGTAYEMTDYKMGVEDTKLIIYKPKRKFKVYDRINKKSAYYYLDIDIDIGEEYPIFSPELPKSYKPHEKNYWKYLKALEYQDLVERRDKLVQEIKSLSESSISERGNSER